MKLNEVKMALVQLWPFKNFKNNLDQGEGTRKCISFFYLVVSWNWIKKKKKKKKLQIVTLFLRKWRVTCTDRPASPLQPAGLLEPPGVPGVRAGWSKEWIVFFSSSVLATSSVVTWSRCSCWRRSTGGWTSPGPRRQTPGVHLCTAQYLKNMILGLLG